jgi:hypothetical protein
MDDVVEIARAAALCECPKLLAEQLGQRVAEDPANRRRIGVGVPDRPQDGTVDQYFVSRQVELHFR